MCKELSKLNSKKTNNPFENEQKDLNRHFTKELRHEVGKQHMKKCSTSLVFKEMQIQTKMRYYYTLIRIATIKKKKNADNTKCCQGYEGRRNQISHTFLVEMETSTAILENNQAVRHLSYNLTITLLNIYRREMKTLPSH